MVCVCAALLATGITLGAAECGISVSVATRVCPWQTQVDDHVVCHIYTCCPTSPWKITQCHRRVALRPVRVSMLYATITTIYILKSIAKLPVPVS